MTLTGSQPESIDVVVSLDDQVRGGDKGIFAGALTAGVMPVPIATLHDSLVSTVEALKKIFSKLPDLHGTLPLEQVQVTFEVTASGKVALIGTGAELSGRGAITLTFGRSVDKH